jgi:hypothetical protein
MVLKLKRLSFCESIFMGMRLELIATSGILGTYLLAAPVGALIDKKGPR